MVGGVTGERGVLAADGRVTLHCTKLHCGVTMYCKELHYTVKVHCHEFRHTVLKRFNFRTVACIKQTFYSLKSPDLLLSI